MKSTGELKDASRDKTGTLYHNLITSGRFQYLLVILMFLILITSALFFIIYVDSVVTETAISSYQTNEMEIVRETARAIQEYVYVQTVVLGRDDINAIEQEVFKKFVDPIRLLENGDAWIYAPDHIVFDQSADLPEEYWGRSMAEIFALQSKNGASHYEEMTTDVTNAREGYGYYIWLPDKGKEIAAWTPVKVENYTWTIGLSTPLTEILDATGASAQIALIKAVTLFGLILALILLVVWIYTDIWRRRAEVALQKSRKLYQTLAESSPDMIYLVDREGVIQYVSLRAAQAFGHTRAEIEGKRLDVIFPPEVSGHHMNEINGVITTGQPRQLEVLESQPDGNHWMNARLSPVKDDDGNVTGVLGISTDITERKRAEDALVESEERYRQLFEQAGDCILIFEAEGESRGRIVAANAHAAAMHGYTVDEILTKNIADLDTPESGKSIDERFRHILSNKRLAGEATHRKKDGTEFPIDINAALLTLGTKRYILAIDRDITERKQAENMIALTSRKLALMNDVTYQYIQNKVTALRGFAELSKNVTEAERVSFIEKEEHILADIHQIITNSKEYQKMGVNQPSWILVEKSVRMAVSLVSPKKDISIEIHLQGLELYFDSLIENVFFILIENAVKHGKTVTRITFSYKETPEGLILACEDDGIGIPPSDKVRLFSRGIGENVGFGMFFIHECLGLSGMTIREIGMPGKGARFEITVPKGMYRFRDSDNN